MNEDGLIERWNELADARERFLAELDLIGEELVNRRPAPGEWSALQVLEHLVASETGTLGYIRKKTSSGWEPLEVAGPAHTEAGEALIERLRSDERYTAPAILAEPQGAENYRRLLERWEQLREEMEHFFFSLDEEFFPRLVFRQPAAGQIHLFHTLEFLRYHLDHHVPQLRRIRAALGE
jgi:uncharacterized damage-inducible protein DinB